MSTPTRERDVYSISRLNREVRMLLEAGLPAVWVEGEISNFSAPASGHWYFTLKDRDAQIRCAMFRARNSGVPFRPKEGQLLQARGRVGLYEPRGDYQLIVEQLEDAGEGALKREFDKLKVRLAAEGLFDVARKRALPRLPRRIAVVTSPTGAAVRDVLHILARRYPPAAVLIHPVPVQGAAAAAAPCTGTGWIRTAAGGNRRARICSTSRSAAPVAEVTTAIRRGRRGRARLRAASNRPSAASRAFRRSNSRFSAPSPASSSCSTISW